jgi:hypothetical protein
MNDKELDQLLDSWEAPPPPRSLREGLRARFPRAERRRIAHPFRWILAIAAASATLAIGMEGGGASPWNFRIGQTLVGWYEAFMFGVEMHHVAYTVGQIRDSEPKVYINGALGQPVEFKHATRMDVNVPGEGVFSVMLVPGIKGFTEAGTIHDNVIEFQAGTKQVRIECNSPIVHSERPVFTRLRR